MHDSDMRSKIIDNAVVLPCLAGGVGVVRREVGKGVCVRDTKEVLPRGVR